MLSNIILGGLCQSIAHLEQWSTYCLLAAYLITVTTKDRIF